MLGDGIWNVPRERLWAVIMRACDPVWMALCDVVSFVCHSGLHDSLQRAGHLLERVRAPEAAFAALWPPEAVTQLMFSLMRDSSIKVWCQCEQANKHEMQARKHAMQCDACMQNPRGPYLYPSSCC